MHKKDIHMILELICEKQLKLMKKNGFQIINSEEYKELEKIKVRVKKMGERI